MKIRLSPSGQELLGNALGDVPTWNGVDEWLPLPGGGGGPAIGSSEYAGPPVLLLGPGPSLFSVVLPGFAAIPIVAIAGGPNLVFFTVNRSHTIDPGFDFCDYVLVVDGFPTGASWTGSGTSNFNTVACSTRIVLAPGPHSIDVQATPAASLPGSGESISHASLVTVF